MPLEGWHRNHHRENQEDEVVSRKMKNGLCLMMAGLMLGSVVTGCKTKPEEYSSTPVATYGDENIYMDEAYFYARLTQYQYEVYYGDTLWSYDFSGKGVTFEDTVRENVMSQIYQTYILNDEAEEMKITLDEEQLKKVTESIEEFMEDEKLVEATNATKEMVEKVYTMNAIANIVFEQLVADTDREVKEEDYLCKTIDYLTLSTSAKDVTDEELEAYAQEILDKMKSGTELKDIEKAFETDDYKIAINEDVTIMKNDERHFQETAWKMSKGDYEKTYSKDTKYWYMIYCSEDDDKEAKQDAIDAEIAKREDKKFEEVYKEILETAKPFEVDEKKWGEIKFIGNPAYIPESTEASSEEKTTEDGSASSSEEASSEESSEETSEAESSTEA